MLLLLFITGRSTKSLWNLRPSLKALFTDEFHDGIVTGTHFSGSWHHSKVHALLATVTVIFQLAVIDLAHLLSLWSRAELT